MVKKINYIFPVLIIVILITYGKCIGFDFNLDDNIILNTIDGKINSVSELIKLLYTSYNQTDYRPIVFLTFGVENLLIGKINPTISHGINILLYIIICIVAYYVIRIILSEKKIHILFATIILFAVHPLNTEVVCSIKCRDNLLSLLLSLLATYYFILLFINNNRKPVNFILFFILSVAAVLAKKDAFGFFILFGILLLIFNNSNKTRQLLVFSICILTVLFSVEFISTEALSKSGEVLKGKVTFTENPLTENLNLESKLIASVNTIYHYFTKLTAINGSRFYYGYNSINIIATKQLSFYVGLVIILFFLIAALIAIRKNLKIILISVAGVFTLSLYALNFVQPVAGIIADRYVFMSNLFFCLFIAVGLYELLNFYNKSKRYIYLIGFIGLVFIIKTINRVPAWKNQKTLIDADAPKLLNSYEAMRITASTYYGEYEKENNDALKKEYLNKAVYYAENGCKVYPKNVLLNLLLGQYYFKNENYQQAISALKKSIAHDTLPVSGYTYLGDVYYSLPKKDSAIYYYKKGLELNPGSQVLINNLSTLYLETGGKASCLEFNNKLLQKDSTLFAAYENLGYLYLNEKDTSQSITYFKSAVKYGLPKSELPIPIY